MIYRDRLTGCNAWGARGRIVCMQYIPARAASRRGRTSHRSPTLQEPGASSRRPSCRRRCRDSRNNTQGRSGTLLAPISPDASATRPAFSSPAPCPSPHLWGTLKASGSSSPRHPPDARTSSHGPRRTCLTALWSTTAYTRYRARDRSGWIEAQSAPNVSGRLLISNRRGWVHFPRLSRAGFATARRTRDSKSGTVPLGSPSSRPTPTSFPSSGGRRQSRQRAAPSSTT